MDTRQQQVLKAVVEEYINSGEPISSIFLADHYSQWGVSPATIRNELMTLMERGFLAQPHTSAGRVPTPKAYRFFVDTFIMDTFIEDREREYMEEIENFFELGDFLARESKSLVLGCKEPSEVYEVGLDYIIEEPEFNDRDFLTDFVSEAERLRKDFKKLVALINSKPHLFIGEEAKGITEDSRFSILLTKIRDEGFALFFSSTRMNYKKSLALANYLSSGYE